MSPCGCVAKCGMTICVSRRVASRRVASNHPLTLSVYPFVSSFDFLYGGLRGVGIGIGIVSKQKKSRNGDELAKLEIHEYNRGPIDQPAVYLSLSICFSYRRIFFFISEIISKRPYVSGLSQSPDVCNGNSAAPWKKKAANGDGAERWAGREVQPSITSLFTDFSTGAMWIFVITEPKLPRPVFIPDSNDDF